MLAVAGAGRIAFLMPPFQAINFGVCSAPDQSVRPSTKSHIDRDPFECPSDLLRVMSYERKWHMRNLVQPPPFMHCKRCNGELRFKRIEPDDPLFDTEVEIFVCSKCGHVHSVPGDSRPLCRTRREKLAARHGGRVGRVQQQVME